MSRCGLRSCALTVAKLFFTRLIQSYSERSATSSGLVGSGSGRRTRNSTMLIEYGVRRGYYGKLSRLFFSSTSAGGAKRLGGFLAKRHSLPSR